MKDKIASIQEIWRRQFRRNEPVTPFIAGDGMAAEALFDIGRSADIVRLVL